MSRTTLSRYHQLPAADFMSRTTWSTFHELRDYNLSRTTSIDCRAVVRWCRERLEIARERYTHIRSRAYVRRPRLDFSWITLHFDVPFTLTYPWLWFTLHFDIPFNLEDPSFENTLPFDMPFCWECPSFWNTLHFEIPFTLIYQSL